MVIDLVAPLAAQEFGLLALLCRRCLIVVVVFVVCRVVRLAPGDVRMVCFCFTCRSGGAWVLVVHAVLIVVLGGTCAPGKDCILASGFCSVLAASPPARRQSCCATEMAVTRCVLSRRVSSGSPCTVARSCSSGTMSQGGAGRRGFAKEGLEFRAAGHAVALHPL